MITFLFLVEKNDLICNLNIIIFVCILSILSIMYHILYLW